VTKTPLGVAVQEDKQINQARDDREPSAAALTGDEPLPQVEDTANPEKLTGDKDQEQREEGQSEEIGVRDQECGKSKDQQQNDRAPMNDDALINCGETDHPRPTLAA